MVLKARCDQEPLNLMAARTRALLCSAAMGSLIASCSSFVALHPTKGPCPAPLTYSKEEITDAQSRAEAAGRAAHDNFAMNALFVNVQERPEPMPCTISLDSRMQNLPPDLPRGCLLKIGPNGASSKDGWMDGDGLVHAITLPPDGCGEIMYSATYVDTNGRKLERKVANGKRFLGTLGAAPQGLPMLANLLSNGLTFRTLNVQKDTCNTAFAVSGSRILALMEQSPPSEIKIDKSGRMRTIGSFSRLDGAIPNAAISGGCLGAHGRTDPVTGERVHVSYSSSSPPFIRVDTFKENWKLQSSVGVNVPSPVMVHDLALTPNYVVLLDFPLTIRPERMFLSNKFPVECEPQNGARIGLFPRGFKEDQTIWFEVETGVVLHAVNAFERDDGKVVVHGFKAVPDGSSSYILDYTPSFLYEWILDPTTSTTISERCMNPNVCVEFPMNDVTGKKIPAAYGLVSTSIGGPLYDFKTPSSGVLLDAFVKLALEDDAESGITAGDVIARFDLPEGWHSVSEPTVVTKKGGDSQYVLLVATYVPPAAGRDHKSVAMDGKSMKTQLLVLDGESISDGPVVSIDLPHRVNYGLHSEFIEWGIMEDVSTVLPCQ